MFVLRESASDIVEVSDVSRDVKSPAIDKLKLTFQVHTSCDIHVTRC